MTQNIRIPVLYLLLLLFLISCKQESNRYIIGVSQCSEDEWRNKFNQEILREAMFLGNVDVEIRNVKDNTQEQIKDICYFIEKNVDLIIVAPNEAEPLTGIIEEAYDKGIAIITFDRNILSGKYTAYVGADNYEIGKTVGNYIASLLNGTGLIAELTGLTGSTPAIDRHEGFMEAIKPYPGIKLICKEDAGWLKESGEVKMEEILSRFDSIDIVYCQNDRMAAGAYQAAQKYGKEDKIRFIGIDALPGAGYGLDLVEKGMLDATFIYPTGGDKIMQIAMDILQGRSFPRETTLNTAVVDSTNAHIMILQTNEIAELDTRIEALNTKIDSYLSRFATQQTILYGAIVIILLVAGLLLVLYKSLHSKNKLNKELSQQKDQLEKQRDQLIELSRQLEEATHAKLVFFTNISHDFRTPLTLVADPVDNLLSDKLLSVEHAQQLKLVKKNVDILLRLVNQILDFRKYENGKLEFAPVMVDLRECIINWNNSFITTAKKKIIHFSFVSTPDVSFKMIADIEKMERIYFNLISNAIKFTPENGKITVTLSFVNQEAGSLIYRLSVANTGSLISAEHVRSIFDRFYKIDMHHAGSGIGLALVKAFVELHAGTINVESDEKCGTIFTADFPVNIENIANLDTSLSPEISTLSPEITYLEENNDSGYNPDKLCILVIDDNVDIRTYIHTVLKSDYSVLQAANASEGIRKAMKYVPDVIISDVMMPGMDGIECCRRLKNEIQTCHIPVILLTACSLDEQRIKGYAGGADSYISKPFNSQVLLSRVRNLIDATKRMKRFEGVSTVIIRENVGDMDKEFVNKFKALIENRMGESDLNVEDLGKEMGLSRVQLYRKIKSLTNYSPNELMRVSRLKKAACLLASSELSVSEICYEVGFSSPSYFTKCYKEQYGESPTDFIKRKNEK